MMQDLQGSRAAVDFIVSAAPRRLLSVRGFQRQPALLIGALILLFTLVASFLGPLLYSVSPTSQNLGNRLAPPFWSREADRDHPLGTDGFGRDNLSRLLYGGRISLIVGSASVLIGGVIGAVLGLLAAFFGGWTDAGIMRLADAQQALPAIVLAIAIAAALGASISNLILVLAITGWSIYARLAYGVVRSLRQREFVLAAIAIGASKWQVLFRHILPGTLTPLLVMAAVQMGRMIQAEAGLSFLGLGVPPPTPTWGSMMSDGLKVVWVTPWVALLPGLAVIVAVLGANMLGDGLRRILDPRTRFG